MNTYISDWLHYNHADDNGQSDDEDNGDSYYDNDCSDLIILIYSIYIQLFYLE